MIRGKTEKVGYVMFSLRRMRFKGDMIEVFKMIHGIEKVNLGKLFCIDEDGRTRKYSLYFKITRYVYFKSKVFH